MSCVDNEGTAFILKMSYIVDCGLSLCRDLFLDALSSSYFIDES